MLRCEPCLISRPEYQDWLDNLPDNLRASTLAEKLEVIGALDLDVLQVEPPRGFGRLKGATHMVAQAEAGRTANWAKIKEWMTLTSVIVVVLVAAGGGMQWIVSSAIAPLRADMQAMNGRMDRMDGRMQRLETVIQEEFKAVHEDITEVRERLARVEALLERDADRAQTPEAPQ